MQKNEKNISSGHSSVSQLTEERATKSNAIEVPSIALPKGGGAIKGIDEKFQVNPSNGTASFSIPLPLSPNRNGFTPSLSISYNSGAGNSVLGIGWGLDFPSIQRKTDKRLPRYRDFSEDEDTFMFSGAEDLAPMLEPNGTDWTTVETMAGGYFIQRFRPRIEGAFSKIERIKAPGGEVYWRVTDRNNITTIFGRNATCRIADPENPARIFQWLPEFSFDDKGSVVLFEYKNEDFENLPDTLFNRNRRNADGTPRFINKYLKRLCYGNTVALYPYEGVTSLYDPLKPTATPANWHFELVLDYGEHDAAAPVPEETNVKKWETRPDPFSDYRAGFEIRTCRLLRRVLMFHRFLELNNGAATLVRSLDFQYFTSDSAKTERETELEFLEKITQTGYIKTVSGYSSKSLPPMTFEYQPLVWNHEVKNVEADDLVHAPTGLSGPYQWVDLYNEGIPGILSEQGEAWHYKHNLGEVAETGVASFAPAKLVAPKPSFTGLGQGVLQLQDLDADGGKQIVVNAPGIQGYFDLAGDADSALPGFENPESLRDTAPFRPFAQHLHLDLRDPNVRLLDLNGDGKPEVVLTEENAFRWWPGAGRAGYEASERSFKPNDEELGPAIVFSDPEQRIFLADMSGDGLTDIVRIRNGEVCYWPNLGYGHFGAKVTMDNSPWFDAPDQFNPAYLQLADISGTGATDLIYLGKNRFKAYLNLSGNAWGQGEAIEPFFPTEQPNRVAVTDLLGNGTACIVWSSELPAYREAPMRYMDLMGGKKPHIMTRHHNGMGKTTAVEYKSSTWFYLKDKLAGTPWITKLPFPVQVVARSIVSDAVTGARFANRYTYHHGYYDHAEREFRGFGRVDQYDTEDYESWKALEATNGQLGAAHHEPPVLARTWFHTGAFLGQERMLKQFEQEYWYHAAQRPDLKDDLLDDAFVELPQGITALDAQEWREAARACKGMALRQEVFSLDGSDQEKIPYTVATHTCFIRPVQPRANNRYAVFLALESEALTFTYERKPEDARVAHSMNLEIDPYAQVTQAAAIVYGRKAGQRSELPNYGFANNYQAGHQAYLDAEQRKTHVVLTETNYTQDELTSAADVYRLPLPYAVKTFAVQGEAIQLRSTLFTKNELKNALGLLNVLDYDSPDDAPGKRLIEQVETQYRSNTLDTALPLGKLESLALPWESYQLAFTPARLRALYGERLPEASWTEILVNQGKFEQRDGQNYWISSGKPLFGSHAQNQFYLPIGYEDPFLTTTRVEYDTPYFLSLKKAVLAPGTPLEQSTEVVTFDYRTLSPTKLKDINGNFSEAVTDELGMPVATAIYDKNGEGDTLDGGDWQFTQERINAFFNDPHGQAAQLLDTATACMVYDLDRAGNQPLRVATIARETHLRALENHTLVENPSTKYQISIEYTDGLGNIALKKVQAEPGPAFRIAKDAAGNCQISTVDTGANLRWIGNGRTILNNKGKPVHQYEPYFSDNPHYEDEDCVRQIGVTPTLYYDAAGRNTRTEMPDGTLVRVEYDAWKQRNYDPNDTIEESGWKNHSENAAAYAKSKIHANTPGILYLDSLGRPFFSLEHNKWNKPAGNTFVETEEFYPTYAILDIEGNARTLKDARNNPVMHWQYDMLGHRLYQRGMDNGARWMLNDCMGKPVLAWDNNEYAGALERRTMRTEYDALHRPTQQWLRINSDVEKEIGRTIYGESIANAAQRNLLGQAVASLGPEGRTEAVAFDFKGNLLESRRQLLADAQAHTVDWQDFIVGVTPSHADNTWLTSETFTQKTAYDALNRMIRLENWHLEGRTPAVYTPQYNERGVLLSETLSVRGEVTQAIRKIEYNEKGRRTRIQYGGPLQPDGSSDVVTTTRYQYDPLSFRLTQLRTTRHDYEPNPGFPAFRSNLTNDQVLQQLLYMYDPVGNITEIHDQAYEPVFFNNQMVEPKSTYTYDALYRLIEAKGRENFHATQEPKGFGAVENMPHYNFGNNGQALRNYTQRYEYDAVGNFIKMQHIAHVVAGQTNAGSWSRYYQNAADSNRLTKTSIGRKITEDEPEQIISEAEIAYQYDTHGNMLNFSNIAQDKHTRWDYRDMIHTLDLEGGGTAYYQYDAEKQRSRKRIVRNTGGEYWERIYLGGYELYRRYQNGIVSEETETHHLFADEQRVLIVEDIIIPSERQQEGLLYRYQYGNHLGSVGLECDDTGEIISYEEYHPYGTTAYQAKNGAIKCAAKRYRYTGMERDEESGLAYHTARYYAAWLGRWGSCDPIGVRGGTNLYCYTQNNPHKFVDNEGLQPTVNDGNPYNPLNYNNFEDYRQQNLDISDEVLWGMWTSSHREANLNTDVGPPSQRNARRGDTNERMNSEYSTPRLSANNLPTLEENNARLSDPRLHFEGELPLLVTQTFFGIDISNYDYHSSPNFFMPSFAVDRPQVRLLGVASGRESIDGDQTRILDPQIQIELSDERIGGSASIHSISHIQDNNDSLDMEVSGPSVSGNFEVTRTSLNIGYSLGYVTLGGTLGDLSPNETDFRIRAAFAPGPQLGLRLKYGTDEDSDNRPEFGLGVDYGDFSVDIEFEFSLFRQLREMRSAMNIWNRRIPLGR